MSKKHLATVAWVIVAALTFVLGWTLKRAPESSDSSRGHGRFAPGNESANHSLGSDNAAAGTVEADASEGSGLIELETARRMNSGDIEAFGLRFKTTLDPIERRLAFAQLLEGLTVENALEIRAQIEHLSPESSEFREFHFAWGKVGGVDAIMHGADTEKPDMAATVAGWASADPNAAIAWLKNLDMENDPGFDVLLKDRGIPAERLRSHFEEGMVRGLASTDTDLATNFVLGLAAAGNKRAEGMLGIVTGNVLRASGPVEAAQWAENLPAGALRSTAMGRVASEYASKNPQAAAAWAGEYVYDEKGSHLVHGITKQWSRQDGEATVAWLSSIGDAPGASGADHSAFEGWARQDPVAASEYLTAMPSSPARDSAISGMVSRHRWEDPVASIVWAESISSEKTRLETLTRAGQAWTRKDPAAAAEWATSSGLPEKLQHAIINPPRDKRK